MRSYQSAVKTKKSARKNMKVGGLIGGWANRR